MALFDDIYKGKLILTEKAIYRDEKNKMLIFCRPSDKKIYGKEAYFKVYDSADHRKARRVARLCFYEPKYIIHDNDPDNCKTWRMNSSEIKNLLLILQKPNNIGIRYASTLEALIDSFNLVVRSNHPEDMIDTNLPIPDYKLLLRKE